MSLLSTSLTATSYLIALQAVSRILTFTLNQFILRFTTPSIFGFATIQLELLLNSILFLCREGFRISVQRQSAGQDADRSQGIINLSWLPVTAGLFLASSLSFVYIQRAPQESAAIPYFSLTVSIYALSTLIELLTEPNYNTALQQLLFKARARSEGTAVLSRCLTTFIASVYGGQEIGALPFALGQLSYSLTLLVAYRIQLPIKILPTRLTNGRWLQPGLLRLSLANTAQGLLKHLLTEGDKFMITWFSTNEEQGNYGLAANYGGLVARIVLQPIEEASRSYFSNLLPSPQPPISSATPSQKKNRQTTKLVLTSILRIYLLTSLLLIAFAPRLIRDTLPLLLQNSRWVNVTDVLAAFCYYIPLLAVNGILESFVTATAAPETLRRQGIWWIPFSIAFGLAGYFFRHHGAAGLVYANCVNLSLRITWAVFYCQTLFGDLEAGKAMPSGVSLAGVAAFAGVVYMADVDQDGLVRYMIKLVASGVVAGLVVLLGEWSWFKTTYLSLRD